MSKDSYKQTTDTFENFKERANSSWHFDPSINSKDFEEVTKILNKNSVHHEELGIITDKDLIINERTKVTIDELKSYNTNWLNNYMSS